MLLRANMKLPINFSTNKRNTDVSKLWNRTTSRVFQVYCCMCFGVPHQHNEFIITETENTFGSYKFFPAALFVRGNVSIKFWMKNILQPFNSILWYSSVGLAKAKYHIQWFVYRSRLYAFLSFEIVCRVIIVFVVVIVVAVVIIEWMAHNHKQRWAPLISNMSSLGEL